ncbi:alpha-mannosidase 2x-like [Mercenaria mercenaria]|uniref:alpha-mannosidase 2x-like n=1 Tax=Mercenaria mercenaria TaxID=6596 RepID=UPI00234EB58E|nr:alpha-mannosidase 2x-like [Mercenaria mercenaria]
MFEVYKELPFDDPDGGVWKQGWQVTYPSNYWNSTNILKIVVVPHSHTDPGWLMTYTEYYKKFVKSILDNMLVKLEQYPEGRFIYAEISFFHLWWDGLTAHDRGRVKRLLDEGRFEIVTGGWVMNDEANTHYFAMIDQLIEGHQWLNQTLGVTPSIGWAIDPFGHTPSMAYLLRQSGFTGMVMQRVHYAVKKYLSKSKQLEFMWRQVWDNKGSTDMLSHLMPYYNYDIPHTCGPDPSVCCEFDFARKPVGRLQCPWKYSTVRAITDANVKERSNTIVDQWKKKAILYKGNVVLVPLGDDFRYSTAAEWDRQFSNYLKLFRYINSHEDLGVKVQFGTLSDYFQIIREELTHEQKSDMTSEKDRKGLESLSGDFFTYADREDHYWSGYFTSRPFQKNLDRKMESHLRGAEILFTLASTKAGREPGTKLPLRRLMKKLITARRNLGLFQHHDGITGTAKDHVVIDYTNRLMESLEDMKVVMRESAVYLTMDDKLFYNSTVPLYDLDETMDRQKIISKPTVLNVGEEYSDPRPVMFYNSIGFESKATVSIFVNSPHVSIRDQAGRHIQSQTEPYWMGKYDISRQIYQISFEVSVSGLGIVLYTVQHVAYNDKERSTFVSIGTSDERIRQNKAGHFSFLEGRSEEYVLENLHMKAIFNGETGLLQSVLTKSDDILHKTEVEFMQYGTKTHHDVKSGAYLFLPDGPAKLLANEQQPKVYILRGPVRSQVHVRSENLIHIVSLYNTTGIESCCVDIQNVVDIRAEHNFELALRITTDTKNINRTFYTDLNGFQIQRRRTYDKLPIQGNVYPMATMAFIQDNHHRHSILTANSLGFSSLEQGIMEVMLDRRLNQDDNRGLFQGVTDNKATSSRFRLLIENCASKQCDSEKITAFPSGMAQQASLDLIHPVFVMPASSTYLGKYPKQSNVSPLTKNLPCDTHLLNLRTMQQNYDGDEYDNENQEQISSTTTTLILHRTGLDCTFKNPSENCEYIGDMFIGWEMPQILPPPRRPEQVVALT